MGFLDSSSDEDSSSGFVKKKAPPPAAAPAPAAKPKSSFLDSDSDDDDSSSGLAKKKAPAPAAAAPAPVAPAPAAKPKSSFLDSDSDEDSSSALVKKPPAAAPAPPPAPAPAPPPPKKSVLDSSDDSSDESSSAKKAAPPPEAAPAPPPSEEPKKSALDSSDSDSSDVSSSVKKTAPPAAADPTPPAAEATTTEEEPKKKGLLDSSDSDSGSSSGSKSSSKKKAAQVAPEPASAQPAAAATEATTAENKPSSANSSAAGSGSVASSSKKSKSSRSSSKKSKKSVQSQQQQDPEPPTQAADTSAADQEDQTATGSAKESVGKASSRGSISSRASKKSTASRSAAPPLPPGDGSAKASSDMSSGGVSSRSGKNQAPAGAPSSVASAKGQSVNSAGGGSRASSKKEVPAAPPETDSVKGNSVKSAGGSRRSSIKSAASSKKSAGIPSAAESAKGSMVSAGSRRSSKKSEGAPSVAESAKGSIRSAGASTNNVQVGTSAVAMSAANSTSGSKSGSSKRSAQASKQDVSSSVQVAVNPAPEFPAQVEEKKEEIISPEEEQAKAKDATMMYVSSDDDDTSDAVGGYNVGAMANRIEQKMQQQPENPVEGQPNIPAAKLGGLESRATSERNMKNVTTSIEEDPLTGVQYIIEEEILEDSYVENGGQPERDSGTYGASPGASAPPMPTPSSLRAVRSTGASSLINGPESVVSSSTSFSSGSGSRRAKQRAFLAQSDSPNMQNIPSQDMATLQSMGMNLQEEQPSQPIKASKQRHSIAAIPEGQQGGRASAERQAQPQPQSQQQQRKKRGQQRHSVAVVPSPEQRLHDRNVPQQQWVTPQERQQQHPPLDVVFTSQDMFRSPVMSTIPASPISLNSSSSSFYEYSVDLNDKNGPPPSDSVPFDEPQPYSREIFQDEYYDAAVKNKRRNNQREKREQRKQRRQSYDPPAPRVTFTPDAKGIKRVCSNVFVRDRSRNMSEISNVSSYIGPETIGPDYNTPLRTPAKSFPPPELQAAIRQAEKYQEHLTIHPTPAPRNVQAALDELEKQCLQWKLYSNRASAATPATASSGGTVWTEDRLTPESHLPRRPSLPPGSPFPRRPSGQAGEPMLMIEAGSKRATFGAPVSSFELPDEEQNIRRQDATAESDNSLTAHALKHAHDFDPLPTKKEETCLESFWNNLAGLLLCLILMSIWGIVLFLALKAGKSGTNSAGGDETQSTPAPSAAPTANTTMEPTLSVPNADSDLVQLLPPSTWDVILRDGNSPQWKAWEWLQGLDTESYSDEQLIQKFSLAVFYFATNGDSIDEDAVNNLEESDTNQTDGTTRRNQESDDDWFNVEGEECNFHEGIVCDDDGILEMINLQNANLQGYLPPEIGLWSNLIDLDLGSNPQLQRTIPTEIGQITLLQGLDMHECALTGSLPSEMGLLSDVNWLSLASQSQNIGVSTSRSTGSTKLSSTLPTELGLMTNLEHLRLQDNQISGSIPGEMGGLVNLQTLVLRGNLVSGEIPPEIGQLVRLEGLALDYNRLNGRVPDEISQLENLKELHLFDNQLTGQLPESLSALSNTLTFVSLSSNSFTGTLPVSWFQLKELQVLLMQDNTGVRGTIPVQWGVNWSKLVRIWMQDTSLEGEVPLGLCFLKEDGEYPLQAIGVDCDAVTCSCGCQCG